MRHNTAKNVLLIRNHKCLWKPLYTELRISHNIKIRLVQAEPTPHGFVAPWNFGEPCRLRFALRSKAPSGGSRVICNTIYCGTSVTSGHDTMKNQKHFPSSPMRIFAFYVSCKDVNTFWISFIKNNFSKFSEIPQNYKKNVNQLRFTCIRRYKHV